MTKREREDLLTMAGRAGAQYVARRLVKAALPKDFPAVERDRLLRAAQKEIGMAIDLVRQRLRAASKAPPIEPAAFTVQWTKVLAACRVLEVKPPKQGRPVDLRIAMRNRRSAMRAYHPDVNPGHEADFSAAVSAYEVLEKYNEELLKKADDVMHNEQPPYNPTTGV